MGATSEHIGNRYLREWAGTARTSLSASTGGFVALSRRIEALPVHPWLVYIGIWLAIFLPYTAMKWLDGTYKVGTFFLFHAVFAGLIVYVPAMGMELTRIAREALKTFRPLLTDPRHYTSVEYDLTHVPRRFTLVGIGAALIWANTGIWFLINPTYWQKREMFDTSMSSVLDYTLFMLLWGLIGATIFRVVHQLMVVNRIYTQHTKINLLAPGPLYEFSRLTSRAGIAILIALYAWLAADLSPLASNGAYIAVIIVFGLIALGAFVQPLLGLHKLLVAEKQRLHDENGRSVESAMAQVRRAIETGNLREVSRMESTVNMLLAERTLLDKLRTWPWEPETIRLVLTATLLPMGLWVAQRLLDKVGF
jgi:hypothetical protein